MGAAIRSNSTSHKLHDMRAKCHVPQLSERGKVLRVGVDPGTIPRRATHLQSTSPLALRDSNLH